MARRIDWDRLTELDLPALAPWEPGLRDGDRLDGVLVDGASGSVRAGRVRVVECEVRASSFEEVVLPRLHATTLLVQDLSAHSVDLTGAELADVVVDRGRIGALLAPGAMLARLTLRGLRLDYVNLRGATLERVQLLDCVVGELDLGLAPATDVRAAGGRLDRLVLTAATCTRVDLSATELVDVEGVSGLAGTSLSGDQVSRLAPALAAHLGITLV